MTDTMTRKTASDTADKRSNPDSKSGSKPGSDLHALFEHALRDMYYAEKKVYKALPAMIRAAGDAALKDALTSHRDETAMHIEALEAVFEMIGKRAKAEKCDAIDGILEEGTSLLEDFAKTETGDAAIIFSAQAVEHYEITRYGSMHAYATALGLPEAADRLKMVLDQEYAADKKLSSLAEGRINAAAA